MTPDDPRHGTDAGYQQHLAKGVTPCEPCTAARSKKNKRNRLMRARGVEPYPQIGHQFWRMACIYSAPDLVTCGAVLYPSTVYAIRKGGPELRVRRATKERFAAADTTGLHTSIGLVRRVRALAAIGWTVPELCEHSGLGRTTLQKYRGGVAYSWPHVASAILSTYDALHMTPRADLDRWGVAAQGYAVRMGWAPPLAWDNIDDPAERPKGRVRTYEAAPVDEIAIERVLSGDRPKRELMPSERETVVTRLHALGLSDAQIADRAGTSDRTVLRIRQRLNLPANHPRTNADYFATRDGAA